MIGSLSSPCRRTSCPTSSGTITCAAPHRRFKQTDQQHLANPARGLLRTYYHLIRHESDFCIAQQDELRLVPKCVTWEEFCDFTSAFREIGDLDVARSYRYGELHHITLFISLRVCLS